MDNTRLDLIKLIGEVTNMESQSVKPDRRAIHDKLVSQLQDFSAPGRIPSVFDIKSCYDLIIDALIACEQNKFFSSKKKLGKLKSFTRYNLYDLGLLVDLYTTQFQSSAIPKGLFTVAIDKLLTPPKRLITALEYTSLTGVPKAETWSTSRLLMQRHNMQQIAAAYSNQMLDYDWVTDRYDKGVEHKGDTINPLDMLDSLFEDSESYKNALAKALAVQLNERFNLNTESGLTFESIADKLLDMDLIVRAIANRDLIKSNHFSAQRRVMNQMDQENLKTFAGALSTKDTSEVTEYDLLKGIVASIDQIPDNFRELAPEVSDGKSRPDSLSVERSSDMDVRRTSFHPNRLSKLTKDVGFNSDRESTSNVTSDDPNTTSVDGPSDNESQSNDGNDSDPNDRMSSPK